MPAQVTMPLEELDVIKARASDAEALAITLQKQLVEARMSAADGEVRRLCESMRAAMEIVGYAVANLSPETHRRWPSNALRKLAEGILIMPDRTPYDLEMAHELTKFAAECETWDFKRKNEPERYIPPPTNKLMSLVELAARVGADVATRAGEIENLTEASESDS